MSIGFAEKKKLIGLLVFAALGAASLLVPSSFQVTWLISIALLTIVLTAGYYCVRLAELAEAKPAHEPTPPVNKVLNAVIDDLDDIIETAKSELVPIRSAVGQFGSASESIIRPYRTLELLLSALEKRVSEVKALRDKPARASQLSCLLEEPLVISRNLATDSVMSDDEIPPIPPDQWVNTVKSLLYSITENYKATRAA